MTEEMSKHERGVVAALSLLHEATKRVIYQRAEVRTGAFVGTLAQDEASKLLEALASAFSGLVSTTLLLELTLLGRTSVSMRKIFELVADENTMIDALRITRDILDWDTAVLIKIRDAMVEDASSEDDA